MQVRGLSQLTKQLKPLKFKRRLAYIDVDEIFPNKNNPRDSIAKEEVADILESIRTMGGVLVPIVVFKERDRYILLDGERRWRASKKLSKQDTRYKTIPANIIEKPLSDIENLQTMFNIHQKRKEWSTAAKAEAIGKLLEIRGDLTVGELERLTGLDNVSVNDSLLLLRFPDDVRQRCLNGELDEFYPILLGRNLKTLERLFPSLFEEYSWNHIASCFMKKVYKGFIRRTRDFHKLGRTARTCIRYQTEILFEDTFRKMISDERFTPLDAQAKVEEELGYKLELSFKNKSSEFQKTLKSYLKDRQDIHAIPESTRKILTGIYELLKDTFFQKNSNL